MGGQPLLAVPSPYSKYGLNGTATSPVDAPLPSIAGPGVADSLAAKPWHPQSPLFWFGVIAAATFGLMAVSVSGRVGPVKAGVSVGTKS